jgi:hypothetical protein
MSLSPASDTVSQGEQFTVEVIANSGSDSVNAGEASLSFNSSVLSVASISQDASVFSLWTTEPEYSNSNGTITFGGGEPAGFSGENTLLAITFSAESTGSAQVSFDEASLLAADGSGSNILSESSGGTYTVEAGSSEPTEPTQPQEPTEPTQPVTPSRPGAGGTPPSAPDISSETHDDGENWYAIATATLEWNVPQTVTAARAGIVESEGDTPETTYEPATSTVTVSDLDDGEYWFSLQLRNQFGWSDVTSRQIRVDRTKPEEFEIQLVDTQSETPKLSFTTEDEHAGVDAYTLQVGANPPQQIFPSDISDGTYPVPPQEGGEQSVRVTVEDAAGNERTASTSMELPAVAPPEEEGEGEGGFFAWVNWSALAAILFAAIAGATYTLHYLRKRQFEAERKRLEREVSEVQEKSEKVFAALREELEEQIGKLNQKPHLTPEERRLLEDMEEALEISEELINSEVDDVRKALD